jgi:hypothetical protein
MKGPGGVRAVLWLSLLAIGPGCVTFYQPQVSLQRPVVVDPEVGNFDGMKLLLRCIPGEYMEQEDAVLLCRRLRPMFTNQGAEVDVEIPTGRGVLREPTATKPDLILDLSARLLHDENSIMLWILSIGTLTLLPAITEYTFAQDVSVRDSNGFLLGTDTLQARFVRYFGLGSLLVTWGLDLVARVKSEKLSGSGFKEEFSKDFYGQLSQIAFHAKMRSMVLHSFEVEAPGAKK